MPIAILAIGKARERYWREAAEEYLKRISRYDRAELVELPALPEPAVPGAALCARVLQREGEALLARLQPRDRVIALCVDAPQRNSVEFARLLKTARERAERLVFVVGGSLGLSRAVEDRAEERLSLSRMTLPHQLARVFLLEQIYRGLTINAGERYHK